MVTVTGDVLNILTVCTHNRTRSVMSMALIQDGLDRRLGAGRAIVHSLGFGPEDMPAIDDAVDAMRKRGLDVAEHRSRQVTAARIEPADLILTAEVDHVVQIATASMDSYRRTFTLPEFLLRAAGDPVADDRSLATWMTDLTADRTPAEYLQSKTPEVWDPTGASRRRFAEQVDHIATMCDQVVDLLVRSFGDSSHRSQF